jgi:predicted MFS family arabinose efflux permease
LIRAFGVEAALGTLAQLTQGVIGLALLLVAHSVGFSVTTGAVAVAAYALGMSVGRPVQGRLLDRISAPSVIVACGVGHGACYVLLAVAAHQRLAVLFVVAGFFAGLTLPPIATQMRAAWPANSAESDVARVFAAITMLQTVSVLIAPVLFTIVQVAWTPTAAMLVVAGVSAVCTVAFGLVCISVPVHAGRRARRYVALLLGTALIGAVTGSLEVVAPALAIGAGYPRVAGPLATVATIGTLVGALVAMRRTVSAYVALSLQVVGAVVLLVPSSLVVAGIGLVVLGLGVTPTLALLSTAVSRRAGGTAESFGWQSTALGLGVVGGSAGAGSLASVSAHLSALPCLVGALGTLLLAARSHFWRPVAVYRV